jgi:archaellum biogenesis protein FlaJ (TadC family)
MQPASSKKSAALEWAAAVALATMAAEAFVVFSATLLLALTQSSTGLMESTTTHSSEFSIISRSIRLLYTLKALFVLPLVVAAIYVSTLKHGRSLLSSLKYSGAFGVLVPLFFGLTPIGWEFLVPRWSPPAAATPYISVLVSVLYFAASIKAERRVRKART